MIKLILKQNTFTVFIDMNKKDKDIEELKNACIDLINSKPIKYELISIKEICTPVQLYIKNNFYSDNLTIVITKENIKLQETVVSIV